MFRREAEDFFMTFVLSECSAVITKGNYELHIPEAFQLGDIKRDISFLICMI
jgi:hypothetical protein